MLFLVILLTCDFADTFCAGGSTGCEVDGKSGGVSGSGHCSGEVGRSASLTLGL